MTTFPNLFYVFLALCLVYVLSRALGAVRLVASQADDRTYRVLVGMSTIAVPFAFATTQYSFETHVMSTQGYIIVALSFTVCVAGYSQSFYPRVNNALYRKFAVLTFNDLMGDSSPVFTSTLDDRFPNEPTSENALASLERTVAVLAEYTDCSHETILSHMLRMYPNLYDRLSLEEAIQRAEAATP